MKVGADVGACRVDLEQQGDAASKPPAPPLTWSTTTTLWSGKWSKVALLSILVFSCKCVSEMRENWSIQSPKTKLEWWELSRFESNSRVEQCLVSTELCYPMHKGIVATMRTISACFAVLHICIV